jgi:hypothetical protein
MAGRHLGELAKGMEVLLMAMHGCWMDWCEEECRGISGMLAISDKRD